MRLIASKGDPTNLGITQLKYLPFKKNNSTPLSRLPGIANANYYALEEVDQWSHITIYLVISKKV